MTTVPIGHPVHNGCTALARAIRWLLAQTHDDFELIVSNNSSTDDTASIVSSFTDPRVRLHV